MHSTRSHENAPLPVGAGLEAAKRPTLGNTVKSSSPCPDKDAVKDLTRAKRKERFKALSQARAWLLPLALQSKPDAHPGDVYSTIDCKWSRIAPTVDVFFSSTHNTAFYGGISSCASVWACPVCCAKIQERRRGELAQLLEWVYANGYQAQMVTFTFPHTRFDSLPDLLSKQRAAFKKLRSGKIWDSFKTRYGYVGLVRSLEVLHGRNGWHPHTHEIFITRPLSISDQSNFYNFVTSRWMKACAAVGLLDMSDDTAVRNFGAHSVDCRFKCSGSDYLAKQDSGRSWGVDREIASSRSKIGRGVHPHEFLVRQDPGDKDLYLDFIHGMKGSRQLYWSTGLKKLVDIKDKTDAEAEAEHLENSLELGALTAGQWSLIRANDARAELLSASEAGGWMYVLRLLAALGDESAARALEWQES